jgi:primosomal protein N' (replication factor Y) (superfamily II helicase)
VISHLPTELSTDLPTGIVDNADPSGPAVLRIALDMPRPTLFEYLPPAGLTAAAVALGTRVYVPVGTRERIGVVVEHAERASVSIGTLKPIRTLIDRAALFDDALLKLLRWTAGYYHHPLGEVIAAALPKGLREGTPAVPLVELWRVRENPGDPGAAEPAPLRRAPRQQALLSLLSAAPDGLAATQIASALPAWRDAARALEARGYIERRVVPSPEPLTDSGAQHTHALQEGPVLSVAQSEAVARIDAAAGAFAAFVLQGATGSGKSEVYLQCALRTLERGRSTLVLVPEIALTPQLVERFRRRLPCPLAVLHSGLSDGERLAAWREAHAGRAGIVLGTRSAVFASMPQLGLIVVDEEHDSSYKQHESGCRYSARDLSVARAQQAQVPIVLGSATPAFETLHNLKLGRYQRLILPRRADQPEAPRLALIDLRAHAVTQGLSAPVIDALRRHLSAGAQVLLFINRRGYAPTLLCTGCGWIAPCGQCDARLTVHRAAAELRCHHCGAVEPLPQRCPRCGFTVKPVGQGTERVEETLQRLFPEHSMVRLDRDTASDARELAARMDSVSSGRARILVGTQIVTKGHHFPLISLVVVLNADQGLFSTDFRAAERLAQTIVQVAGRAGREHSRGEVLIQTDCPDHPLLQSLLDGGYDGFAELALRERAAAHWPPFGRLAVLRASALTAAAALEFLSAARAAAPEAPGVRLLGPVAAAMARRAGRYYAHLLLDSRERRALHHLLDQWLPALSGLPQARRVRFALDVDPLEIQ